MANVRRGPLHFVDTAGILSEDQNVKLAYVLITATASSAVLELADSDGTVLLSLALATDGDSQQFDFSNNPLVFSKGLKAQTVTNCTATVVYTNKGSTN